MKEKKQSSKKIGKPAEKVEKPESKGLLKYMSARTIITIGIIIGVIAVAAILYQTYKFQLNIQAMPLGEYMRGDVVNPETGLMYPSDSSSAASSAAEAGAEAAEQAAGGEGAASEGSGYQDTCSASGQTGEGQVKKFCINCSEECNLQFEALGAKIKIPFSEWADPICKLTCLATKSIFDIVNQIGDWMGSAPL